MADTEQQPAAWEIACERFQKAWGSAFDANDPNDVALFLPLLDEEVHERISRAMVRALREATAQKLGELRELRERQ